MVSLSIKRVVSVFVLRPKEQGRQLQVALFRRCDTMPTFPGHWAGISGSLEDDDAGPLAAAARELGEETNLKDLFGKYSGGDDGAASLRTCLQQGLHVDVEKDRGRGAFGGRVIRVYPFSLTLPSSSLWSGIEMKGTEHDRMQFVDIADFLAMDEPCVPSLRLAFHHATRGGYLKLPKEIRTWEEDRVNGAAFLARQAVALAATHTIPGEEDAPNAIDGQPSAAKSIAMLRPSMVPIANVMREFDRRTQSHDNIDRVKDELLLSLDTEAKRCVDLAVETVLQYYKQWQLTSPSAELTFAIGTFSRSSTLRSIFERVQSALEHTNHVSVVCSRSTPGDEGELMASDLNAKWLPDESFQQQIEQGQINLVIVGADCILPEGRGIVNKVGTAALATTCKRCNVPIMCSADRWKLWDDEFPPPLEDIFEVVPSELLSKVLVPAEHES
ncbi:hypothetical protein ACHAXT_013330 [Thalassiosira profunda]